VQYLRLSRNCGSHAAFSAGLKHCTGDCAVLLAADLQDPPEAIPALLEQWKAGSDVVWAVRSARAGERWTTKLFAGVYYSLMRRFALPEMPATGADFLLLDRKVINAYNAIPEKNTSFLAMILWMGFRQTSIEYVKKPRRAGRSKWTVGKKVKLLIDSLVSFSYMPIRVMSLFGLTMAFAGFVYALVVIVGRLAGWVAAGTGFAALMTVLLVGQGLIMTMLGVLGEYLWRTFDEARGRPRYIIEEHICAGSRQVAERRPSDAPSLSKAENGHMRVLTRDVFAVSANEENS
jgi:dolichol-phosphate mannosyltransferase